MREILPLELADECAITALAHVQRSVVSDVVHEPHAPGAEDTAVWDVENVAAKIFYGIESLRITVSRVGSTFLIREVLQLAFARLVADRTVEGMIDQQELEHSLACLECPVVVNVNDLTFGYRCRA